MDTGQKTSTHSQNILSPAGQILFTVCFIGVTYLWTAAAYLSWTAHLSPLASETVTYFATEVGGCITQIIGLFLFSWVLRHNTGSAFNHKMLLLFMILDGLCILPVAFSGDMLSVLMWGMIMNLFHGGIAGYYIARLSYFIPKNRRAVCFGAGYAIGSIGSYLLSLLNGGDFLAKGNVWFAFAFLILISCLLLTCLAPAHRHTPRPQPRLRTR